RRRADPCLLGARGAAFALWRVVARALRGCVCLSGSCAMAQMILSNVGNYLGSQLPGVWGSIGASLGQAAGSALGSAIDQRLFSETLRRQGARLTDLHVQTSSEG